MCLILMAWQVHPDYPVVMAANRDEFRRRPTAPAAWWTDHANLLAGRDLEAHGTWLGITAGGQIAALTNFRDPNQIKPQAPSRGGLVLEMLESRATIGERLAQLRTVSGRYAGFNLLCTDGHELGVYESVPATGRMLGPGIYGLSNHLLDTPWPKVQRAKSNLATALRSLPDDTALLELLRDDRVPADDELPRTGVSLDWERLLSSAFIRGADYGTRSSTVVRIGIDGQASFHEWSWNADGSLGSEVRFEFQIEPTSISAARRPE
ncbi:MAG TPA: NRDE family protein [Steroidobacteraceae bacterium]|jgi:uncharacterized protein with NRDE domain|nr:NRDE family protein [Steroidobacteraceae bacterium]